MTLQEKLEEYGYYIYELNNSLQIDGYDDACIGVSENEELIYDYSLLVKQAMKDGCTYEEAVEYVDFNIVQAKFSQYINPVIVHLFKEDEWEN